MTISSLSFLSSCAFTATWKTQTNIYKMAGRSRGSTFAGFTAKVREKISAKPQDLSGFFVLFHSFFILFFSKSFFVFVVVHCSLIVCDRFFWLLLLFVKCRSKSTLRVCQRGTAGRSEFQRWRDIQRCHKR